MAALYPDTLNRRILVKKVPFKTNHEELCIYFLKTEHGGCGDVASITFPKSKFELDQAVVVFKKNKTMKSVLFHHPHILHGQQIDVTEFPEQAFGNTTVVISDVVQTKLQQLPDSEKIFLLDSTGVLVTTDNDKMCISGHWYQVNAAVNKIETLIDDSINTAASAGNATSGSMIQSPQNITGLRKDEKNPVMHNIYAPMINSSHSSVMQTIFDSQPPASQITFGAGAAPPNQNPFRATPTITPTQRGGSVVRQARRRLRK